MSPLPSEHHLCNQAIDDFPNQNHREFPVAIFDSRRLNCESFLHYSVAGSVEFRPAGLLVQTTEMEEFYCDSDSDGDGDDDDDEDEFGHDEFDDFVIA